MGVCDISADYNGSIEFTSKFTSIEEPFLVWDAKNMSFRDKIADADNNCILFHSVDHLPAEMPKEASNHFGEQLCQFVEKVANSDINAPWEEQVKVLPAEISNAIICAHGELTPNYKYIAELRELNEKMAAKQQSAKRKHEENEIKNPSPKGLKRNLSLVTLSLQGHLFDTKCFNDAIDQCEEYGVQFRVIDLNVGNTNDQDTRVSIQLMTRNKMALEQCVDGISSIASKCGVQILQGDEASHDKEGDFYNIGLSLDKN